MFLKSFWYTRILVAGMPVIILTMICNIMVRGKKNSKLLNCREFEFYPKRAIRRSWAEVFVEIVGRNLSMERERAFMGRSFC